MRQMFGFVHSSSIKTDGKVHYFVTFLEHKEFESFSDCCKVDPVRG